MDIPVAVPVGSCHGAKIEPYASSELYVLEQHQEALRLAEKGLEQALAAAEDFFSSPQERDSTYTEIQERPDDVYDKPFKRKIAQAVLEVRRCRAAVEWASESVVDTSLTPAQVKAQVKQMLDVQRIYMERKISEERSILEKEMRKLREELEEERQHRLAFQANVKDFSEDVLNLITYTSYRAGGWPCGHDPEARKFEAFVRQRYGWWTSDLGMLCTAANHGDAFTKLVLESPLYKKYQLHLKTIDDFNIPNPPRRTYLFDPPTICTDQKLPIVHEKRK